MDKPRGLLSKTLVVGIIFLLIGTSSSPINGAYATTSTILDNNGSLLGYVNDIFGNPIERALVRVHFHDTYEEDYSDSTGFYHVTNIPICYCMKNTTCSKDGYKTEWVLLSIAENTTYDFVLTSGNNPPIKPDKPSGPTKVRLGVVYTYTAVTTDPDNDKISYLFDWGDGTTSGWTEFVPSGTNASASHVWSENSYGIRVKAKDEHDAESEWSAYLHFDRNRTTTIVNLPILRFLENFSLLEVFLRIMNL